MNTGYQNRNKFFYAAPRLFPYWPYKSRNAIGMNFKDFVKMNAPTFRFKVKDTMYEIDRQKAKKLGNTYKLYGGTLPNIIPIDEFEEVKPIEQQKLL
jgi:hypothetical protein